MVDFFYRVEYNKDLFTDFTQFLSTSISIITGVKFLSQRPICEKILYFSWLLKHTYPRNDLLQEWQFVDN